MSANLKIHVLEGVSKRDLEIFFSTTTGSKYFRGFGCDLYDKGESDKAWDNIADSPQCSIGEVSWLKAALCDDEETFVPSPVMKIHEIIGDNLPTITDGIIIAISNALKLENTTDYKVASKEDVIQFLEEYKGKKIFTVSW